MSKKFKYFNELSKYTNCPGINCIALERVAYRWLHKPATDQDFIPESFKHSPPQRLLKTNDQPGLCNGYSLSLFGDFTKAKTGYLKIYKSAESQEAKENVKMKKGSHIGRILLKKEDGVAELKTEYSGHFNFFEYEGNDYLNRIAEIIDIFDK